MTVMCESQRANMENNMAEVVVCLRSHVVEHVHYHLIQPGVDGEESL